MTILKLMIALSAYAFVQQALAGDWKPAKAPLMTKWAKDVSPDKALPEYPRPQLVRKDWQSLNGLWEFEPARDVSNPPTGKQLSKQILVPFCMESALSGVMEHHDQAWYRRTFAVPGEWKNRRILLHFGAVDFESTVYVNGKKLGSHTGGYDAFSFDITDALKPEGDQELIVAVTDRTDETQSRGKQHPNPHGIWYVPCSGIWQTVWLEPVADKAISALHIATDVDASTVRIDVEPAGAQATIEVLDGANVIATGAAGAAIKINGPKLWSPDSPFLYQLRIRSGDDAVESYFGMRKIELATVDGVRRILLNGKPVMQVGPLDQGYWPDGNYTAPTDEALKFDLDLTKRLGFNMIRKHVKVEPQRWYYWADKMGFLVWQDMPSMFNAGAKDAEAHKQFEKELKQLVDQHRNSPSIIMWVPFNEGWGQYETERVTKMVKDLDPTRLVNNASGWTDAGAGDVLDIHAYPGPAAPKQEKQRAIVLGEFGGLGLGVDQHTWAERAWGYQGMASQSELTDKYVRLMGRLWDLMENEGLCAGVYTQTTDVETECNGLITYDREVLKIDESKVREANLGKGPRYMIVNVVPTAQQEPSSWQYTTDKPAQEWATPAFDASGWKTGKSGFGTEGTPGSIVNTAWNTPDIWLRREITIPQGPLDDLRLIVHHDEDCEIYLNGVLANRARRHTTDYVERAISPEAMKTLKPGKNTLAVHCRQTTGGQFIDVGITRITEKRK
ncbi:MAG TPA: glycoside hydrolase family 2 TIM barrel-domain containing protein [Tepidisphaeraceae bacterium]|jgi:hypothetical protein